MLNSRTLLCLLVTALTSTAVVAAPSATPTQPIDRILIVVNDDAITASDVERRLTMVSKRLQARQVKLPPQDVLRRQVMERMVVEQLQLQLAREQGLSVSEERLDQTIQEIADQNQTTLEALRREAAAEPGGWSAFREEIRAQALIQMITEREVHGRVAVGESEIENFLANPANRAGGEEFNLAHILIALPESASPEVIAQARQKTERLHAELKQGADFGQLAASHSQGQNALEGGTLGWKPAGQLPDLFLNALQTLRPGEISDVLRSPNGFHILRLVERRGGNQPVHVTQTHARHILLRPSEMVPLPEVLRRLELIRERLVNGADFAQTARTHSEDIVSAAKGGDLGWLNPGQTVPAFEQAMNALKPNELSLPVRSSFGVHLIQVLERRNRDVSHEREQAAARNQLLARKADERLDLWLRQLRDEAYVDYRTDPH